MKQSIEQSRLGSCVAAAAVAAVESRFPPAARPGAGLASVPLVQVPALANALVIVLVLVLELVFDQSRSLAVLLDPPAAQPTVFEP